jgi:hypothetical protein
LIMSYVLAIELTPKEHHSYYSSLPMIFDSLGMIFLGGLLSAGEEQESYDRWNDRRQFDPHCIDMVLYSRES